MANQLELKRSIIKAEASGNTDKVKFLLKELNTASEPEAAPSIEGTGNGTRLSEEVDPVQKEEENESIVEVASPYAAEMAISASSNVSASTVAGYLKKNPVAAGLAYAAINYGGGYYGSYVRQDMQGGEFSFGEAHAAGAVNLMFWNTPIQSVAAGSKITSELVKSSLIQGFEKGAITGGAEVNMASLIDTGELATAEETIKVGVTTGIFGSLFQTAGLHVQKAINKFNNKTAKEIDIAVANGDITTNDLVRLEGSMKFQQDDYSLFQKALAKLRQEKELGPVKPFMGDIPKAKEEFVYVPTPEGELVKVEKSMATQAAKQSGLDKPPKDPLSEKPNPKQPDMFEDPITGKVVAFPEIEKKIKSTQKKVRHYELVSILKNAVNDPLSPMPTLHKMAAWAAPSSVTGRGIQDEVFQSSQAKKKLVRYLLTLTNT